MGTEVVVPSDGCCWDLPVRRGPIGVDVHFRVVLRRFLFIKLMTGVKNLAKEIMMKPFEGFSDTARAEARCRAEFMAKAEEGSEVA